MVLTARRSLLVLAAAATAAGLAVAVYAQGAAGRQGGGTGGRAGGAAAAQPSRPAGADWLAYGFDAGARRYSPLAQITPQNVASLTRAWTFDTEVAGSQYTPLVIDGVMYVSNTTHLIALEPETGKVIYNVPHEGISRRGLAYWPGDGTIEPRFFSGVNGGRMVAIDVRTGQPSVGFGT